MYLVRHMRGMASELGLKQLFRLLSNTLGMQNKILLKTKLDQTWSYSNYWASRLQAEKSN